MPELHDDRIKFLEETAVKIRQKIKFRHFVSVLALGGLFFVILSLGPSSDRSFFAALKLSEQPLFSNADNFVLFADQEIELAQFVQVSSGDLGSNGKVNIQKDNIINGNLFAKEIFIDKDTQINGNASYNKLKLHKDSRILGATTTPVSLPVANLPDIPPFSVGTQDLSFQGENNVLNPGSYWNITLEKDSRLTLPGGTYNLNKLELKENSTLIYNSSTILNIQFKLKGQQKALILPGNNNLSATDLLINYQGFSKPFKIKEKFLDFFRRLFSKTRPPEDEEEDDDEEINRLLDAQERKDLQKGKIGNPIIFNNDSFLNFKLLAPKANVKLGERTTLRGQVLAKKIKTGKSSILSREDDFIQGSDPAVIVTDADNSVFPINEIIVNFNSSATFSDAQQIADFVEGRIVGFVELANAYQIEVAVNNIGELKAKIQSIRDLNNPLVEGVFRNYILDIF